ncbi:MAG TPA: MMPL family transporter [Thermoanaerobaculia bacterium]|nr:MMPL family transporter [Thermoanaerobaculia bacterium]
MTALLERLALLARRRYRFIFTVFALLVTVSVVLISRLSFDTDMLNLLPRNDPTIRSYLEMLRDFGSSTYVLIAIKLPAGAVPDPYEALADDLAARVARLPEIKSVQHRSGNPEELLTTFFPKAVLFLDPPGQRELAAKLTDAGIRNRVSELRRQLATPQALGVKELAKLDPFGLAGIFLGHLDSSRGTLQVDWASGYYLSRDHRLLLLLVEPVRPPQDIPFDERLTRDVDRAIAGSLARWTSFAGADGPPPPAVDIGGPYLTALTDATLIRHDMFVNVATSALGVFLLFLFAFRRVGALLYAFVPLLCGLALTFGFAAAVFGALSSATSVCAALLIGLGIDFVIVSYGRYVEERRRGAGLERGLVVMSGACGGAVIAGALTTAATFYAFTFTEFTGLRQMGLLTGTGILFCMISVLLLLPAMLAWSADREVRRRAEPRLFLHSFGINRLTGLCMRHPVAAMAAALAVTALALAASFHVQFDESMKTMRPTVNRGTSVSEEVGRRFGSGFDAMILSLSGQSLDEVLALSERAVAGARRLVEADVLQNVSGASSLIPPLELQRQILGWLARERRPEGALDLARIRATLAAALRAEGLRAEPFAPGVELLSRALELSRPIGVADFSSTRQTKILLERYLKRTGNGWRAAVYFYPPPDARWRREPPPGAVELAAALGPRARLAGVNVINQRIKGMVVHDAWIAGVLGLVLVAVILWVDFRSPRLVALALTPLALGIVLMVGAMAALNVQLNFVNIFVTTMVIGIGSDYGIYIVHRYGEVRALSGPAFETGLRETGKAVAAAAICTVVGFGSIIFSHYPGLRSTGEVAILGAFSTALVAITVLPAFFAWRATRRR